MARRSEVTATKTNYEDYLIDPAKISFEGYEKSSGEEEPGFLSKAGNTGLQILEGLTMVPKGLYYTLKDVWNGGDIDVSDEQALADREAWEREKEAYLRKYQGKAYEGAGEAMISFPYSGATLAAGLLGGVAGAAAGPVGSAAAGMAASGAAAYRATKEDFMQKLYAMTRESLGRKPTQEEWNGIAEEFDAEATQEGLWEAGPEALGNLLMIKFLGALGKKSGVWGAIKAGLKSQLSEQATETVTQYGQGGIDAKMGWRDKAPTLYEA